MRRSARPSPVRIRAKCGVRLRAVWHGLARRLRSDAKQRTAPRRHRRQTRSSARAEKGPVKLFVRVWPREPRLSDLVEMDVRVESQPGVEIKPPAFGQAVGDFLIRDYSERPAEAGAGERAPLPLSAGAGARRQAPDPVGVDRIRGQTPEFGTAG